MIINIKDLRAGDILSCEGNGWISKGISFVTKSPITHSARIISINEILYVIDSQSHGTNPVLLEEWLAKYKYSFYVHREHNVDIKKLTNKLMSKSGITFYDFASLIIWQPLYILTGYWKGHTEEDADKRAYCSEFQAWGMEVPEYWKYSPVALYNYMNDRDFKYKYVGYFKYEK